MTSATKISPNENKKTYIKTIIKGSILLYLYIKQFFLQIRQGNQNEEICNGGNIEQSHMGLLHRPQPNPPLGPGIF